MAVVLVPRGVLGGIGFTWSRGSYPYDSAVLCAPLFFVQNNGHRRNIRTKIKHHVALRNKYFLSPSTVLAPVAKCELLPMTLLFLMGFECITP